ncbi:hypothetical protein CLOSYM_00072 [[Clostridium] symbiosum ATCC 14940]|uniref:Uncharacterized protein n=1 Tax=[Clostridium] symbiosum ATCC 14940 TaxID=411472 RepID=A0ABC9U3X9_CLOSY|nr:hypothetical protein CLOSYM_00072 [[Clostridium] symbiosum ATCC 14940]
MVISAGRIINDTKKIAEVSRTQRFFFWGGFLQPFFNGKILLLSEPMPAALGNHVATAARVRRRIPRAIFFLAF